MGSGGFVGGGLVTVCMVVMQMCAREQLYTGYLDITVCIGVVGSQSVLGHTKSSGFAVCLWVLYD